MKSVLFGLAGAVVLAAAVPASAAVIICQGTGQQCAPQTDANVLLTTATNVNLVQGTFNGGGQTAAGVFDSSENLDADANGQAVISATDGSVLNDLTFSLTNGSTFGVATFNLSAAGTALANEATSVSISFIDAAGVSAAQTFAINTNGSNFFGISGTAGERFTGFTFAGNPTTTGIADFRQLRLGNVQSAVAAVPEPGTWAMMLLGFGAIGASMRRRKGYKLAQVA